MKTRPIVLPIDPKKTYVTRSGCTTSDICSSSWYAYPWDTNLLKDGCFVGWVRLTERGRMSPDYDSPGDLILEVVDMNEEEPTEDDHDVNSNRARYMARMKEFMIEHQKTNPVKVKKKKIKERDWSDVIDAILTKATSYYNAPDFSYKFKQLEADTLAILQEFDRQSQPVTQAQSTSAKENREMPQLVTECELQEWAEEFVCVAYPGGEARPEGVLAKTQRLLRVFEKHIRGNEEYTMEEIEEELNTWQDEPISPVHFCRRGKMIRQLVKALNRATVRI